MSVFILKLIAMITMLIDHIAATYGWYGWNIMPYDATGMRYIGRIAFPIFAFCIINGWKYTRDRKKYFMRLCMGAIVSQIPFSLVFYPPNVSTINETEKVFTYWFNAPTLIVGVIGVVTYWYFVQKRKADKSTILVSAFFLLPAWGLKVGYMWVLCDSLNVLYTFALGCAVLYAFEQVKAKALCWWEYVWLFGALILAIISIGYRSDYGINFMGFVLMIALYFSQRFRLLQTVVIAVWGFIFYGLLIGNMGNAYATVIPAILVLLYNPEKGGESKWMKSLFYAFYPLHLIIIGIINVFIRIG